MAGSPPPEHLPLSASSRVRVEVELARANRSELRVVDVEPGTRVRELLRSLAQAPEGSAVLLDGTSIPLDTRIQAPMHLTVVSTFSGG